MYNDGVITTEFTGYYDSAAGEYISPSAGQNLVIKFADFYLSAKDNDFTDSGATITSETGDAEDITIGNAPAKVLTASMLNPNGLMEGLTWGEGAVYIGAVTATASADAYQNYPVHVLANGVHYGLDASGNARRGTTSYTLGGDPLAVASNAAGTDVLFITSTKIGRYNGSFSVVSTPTAAQAFLAAKFSDTENPIGIVLDANGCPAVYNDVLNDSKTTYTYVPMGVYDFSGVDAYGITFGVEAYDRMTLFDSDATDWVGSLDFTTAKTLSGILSELMTEMGFSGNYTVSASAVNGSLSYAENPITAYAVTYRQVLRWIAEAMGCNVRMSRTGGVELYTFNSTSQETITPYTIISNTRTKARYTVPQITEVVCYDTLGYNYASGSEGVPYYIAANPFLTGLDTSVQPLTNICTLLRAVPVYYPSTIGQMYADPRLDTGDFVTIQTTDGTATYVVPVMRQTLHWSGVCEATLVASGNQTRAVPSDLVDSNLATTVNGRKILEGVDAKRITVLDEQENVLFNADTETDEVNIAGFTVTDNGLDYTLTEPSGDGVLAGHTNTALIHVGTDGVERSVDAWEVFEDDSDDPPVDVAGEVKYSEVLGGDSTANTGFHAHYEVVDTGALGYTTYTADSYLRAESLVFDMDFPGEINTNTTRVNADGMRTQLNNAVGSYGTRIVLSNSTHTKIIDASGPTPTSGYDQVSVPTGTAYHTVTSFDLEPGTYLIQVHFAFNTNGNNKRVGIVSYSADSAAQISAAFRADSVAVPGINTYLNICGIVKPNTTTTFYLNAMQDSGSALATFASYNYVRLA